MNVGKNDATRMVSRRVKCMSTRRRSVQTTMATAVGISVHITTRDTVAYQTATIIAKAAPLRAHARVSAVVNKLTIGRNANVVTIVIAANAAKKRKEMCASRSCDFRNPGS